MSRVLAVVTEDPDLENRVKLICQGVSPQLNPRFYGSYDDCLASCDASEGNVAVAILVDQSAGIENSEDSDSRSPHQAALFYQRLRSIGGQRFTPLIVVDSPITPVHLARGSEYTFFRIVDKSGHESVLQAALGALAAELARPSALRQSLNRVAGAWQNGQEGEVEHILEECYQTFNDDEEVLLEYGSLCLRKGRLAKAEKVFAKLVNKPSQSLRVANFLARVQLKQGNVTAALGVLDKANLLSPGNLDRLVLMGDAFRIQGSMTDAEEKYEEALEIDGNFGDAKKGVGLVALSQGEIDRAIEFFRGTCTEEETVGFFNNTAVMAVKRAQFGHAEQLYHAAAGVVATPKTRAKVHFNLGLMYRRWNRASDAAESFRTALSLDSQFSKAERHLSAMSAGLSGIAAIGAGVQQSASFDVSDETFIGVVTSPEQDSLSALRQTVHVAVTEEGFSDEDSSEVLDAVTPEVNSAEEARLGKAVPSVGVGPGRGVRTVELPSKDVKPFAAEQLSKDSNSKPKQIPRPQASKSAAAGPGKKTTSKEAPRFIDDEGVEHEDGDESNASSKGPKKAG